MHSAILEKHGKQFPCHDFFFFSHKVWQTIPLCVFLCGKMFYVILLKEKGCRKGTFPGWLEEGRWTRTCLVGTCTLLPPPCSWLLCLPLNLLASASSRAHSLAKRWSYRGSETDRKIAQSSLSTLATFHAVVHFDLRCRWHRPHGTFSSSQKTTATFGGQLGRECQCNRWSACKAGPKPLSWKVLRLWCQVCQVESLFIQLWCQNKNGDDIAIVVSQHITKQRTIKSNVSWNEHKWWCFI